MADTKLLVPAVEVAHHSDPGRDPEKQVNEDSCLYAETPFGQLMVLCDGMGGHEGGREASTVAVDAIYRYVSAAPQRPDMPPAQRAREVLRDAVAVANQRVYALSTAKGASRPGSTVVALLLHPLGTEIAHVGDSRCYVVHEGHIRQVTRDHSMVQQMVDAGVLTPEKAAIHPDANKITRALGMGAKIEVELQRNAIAHEAGDVFVLCSDGLSDLVEPNDIVRVVTSAPPAQAVKDLVDLANARGGHDNITVMVMRALEPAHASTAAVSERALLARTETMPAVHAPSSGRLPDAAPSHRTIPMADVPPLAPPAPLARVPRRRASPVVVLGVSLGLVGVVVAGAVILLEAVPPKGASDVPSPSLSVVLPASSLTPGPDTDDYDAAAPLGFDAGTRARHSNKKRPRK